MTRADITRFIHAVRDSDEAVVDDAVTRLSRSRPWLAPLTFAVGAFAMLFDGVRAVICTPPYILGRVGLLMLGLRVLFPLGVVFFAVGLTLQAGATGAVKAVRMSAKLVSGRNPAGRRGATRFPEG